MVFLLITIILIRIFIITPISVFAGQGLRGGLYGLAGMTLIVGALNVVSLVAVRHLKRWGLILFTALSVFDMLTTAYTVVSYTQFIPMAIYIAVLAFWWNNYDKFK